MSKIVGVQFTKHGKIHYYDTGHYVLKKGIKVLVETEHGSELGVVCTDPKNYNEGIPERTLRKIFRLAADKDVKKYEKKGLMEKDVYAFCYKKIKEKGLPMCLVSVKRFSDGSKVMVYFTADGRVDFRELVKDLAQKFRTRVEMRQIGVRNEAKMIGALGTCGRHLCCSSFLNSFAPVSIKMAKEQNLSLNPTKISGMCGRLMCCLTYEYEYYQSVKKTIPKVGERVSTSYGDGKVIRQNLLREQLMVSLDSGEEVEVSYKNGIIKKKKKKE
ncbi:stage 0 sporulation family protein [Thermodesulfobacteriota bacterium]